MNKVVIYMKYKKLRDSAYESEKYETLKNGNVLLEIKRRFLENPNKDMVIPLVDCLTDSLVYIPMNAEISEKNAEIMKNAKVGEEIQLADDSVDFEEIITDFDNHINKNWNQEDLSARIIDYDKNDMVYLNEYLFAKENNKQLIISSDIDIEHIMPQSGKNKDIIKSDAGMEDLNMFNDYINKIGNKILLEYDINRSIGNEWFRTKIATKITDKSGYVDSKYPIAQYLVELYKNNSKPYWTKDDIDTATIEAAERITRFIFGK